MPEMSLEIEPGDEFQLVNYEYLADMLGVSVRRAREVVASGAIPLVEVGPRTHRVTVASIKRFIAAGGFRGNL